MGMGYGANYADTIELEELKKIAPQEWKALEKACKENDEDEYEGFTLEEIACGNMTVDHIMDPYEALRDAVYKKSGMDVNVGYHNSEDHGDRYDEVEGVYWSVDNAFIPNPKINRGFQQKINRNFFVTYG